LLLSIQLRSGSLRSANRTPPRPVCETKRLALSCRPPPELVEAGTDTLWGEIKEEVTATGRRRGTFARQGIRARHPITMLLPHPATQKKGSSPI
ncbi:hypothetical protein OEZ78_27810, partial [Leclercia adecarboxylata]|uniref:hypothetical protein n=1 Tax=Leclercia adecarboxylata TaxID=83655 RepID=UPI00234D7E27